MINAAQVRWLKATNDDSLAACTLSGIRNCPLCPSQATAKPRQAPWTAQPLGATLHLGSARRLPPCPPPTMKKDTSVAPGVSRAPQRCYSPAALHTGAQSRSGHWSRLFGLPRCIALLQASASLYSSRRNLRAAQRLRTRCRRLCRRRFGQTFCYRRHLGQTCCRSCASPPWHAMTVTCPPP